MKCRFINNYESQIPIEKMCKVLKIDPNGYFKWKNKGISNILLNKKMFKEKIRKLYFEFKQRYGNPRITTELEASGHRISRVTVAKYMNELGLRSKLSKKFKVTTNSNYNYLIVENVLDRDLKRLKKAKNGYLISLIFKQKMDIFI